MGHKQYCVYNGTAKVMPANGLELMKQRCSHLLEGGSTEFCCDSDQVNKAITHTYYLYTLYICVFNSLKISILNENIKLAANFLERCPSCMANLVRHLCDLTCSPKQSGFSKIAQSSISPAGKLKHCMYVWVYLCLC